jgi:outer membrane protein TolC
MTTAKLTREKTAKGGRARKRILETASAMMAENGPDGVSMRELSLRLKITKPVIYYYFKNKDELIRAAFKEGTKHFDELNTEINDPKLTLEQRLARIFSRHLEFIRRYPDMPKCALKIMASPSSGVLSSLAMDLKLRNRNALKKILSALADKEGLSRTGIADILHMVSAVVSYFMIEAREHGTENLDKGLPGRLAAMICAGARSARALVCAAALPLLLSAANNASAMDLGLEDAVKTALGGNSAVITARETRGIYKERVREYWGTVFPQLSATGLYTHYLEKPSASLAGLKTDNIYTGSLDLNQVLWAGGKVRTAIRMARMYSSASDEQLKSAQKLIAKSVRQMYYTVLLSSSLAGIQNESLNLAVQHLATIEAQYKQGLASDLAVLRQKVEVSNTEPALTQARNRYEEGLIDLKNLLGLDPETDIRLTDSLSREESGPGDIGELYRTALLNRPEYRNQKLQRDLYHEMTAIEKAGHFPYLSAFASRQYLGLTDAGFPEEGERTWSTTAGLRLSLPIFSGGSVSSRVKQARMRADIADNDLRELERRIKIEVKKAWLTITEASGRLASQTAAVETARKALTATELRFKNGLASQLELNDTSLALNRSQTLYIQALHDTCSAKTELQWALGE